MNIEEQIALSETHQFKMVFHNTVNDHETLFGGIAMQWMDEVAYITAKRFTHKNMVTVSTDKVNFLKPIKLGSIVKIVSKVVKVKGAKMNIKVEIFIEETTTHTCEKAIEAAFTFAAINKDSKPVRIFHTEDSDRFMEYESEFKTF